MHGCFLHTLPFYVLCDAMFTMFVRATCWLSMHLYMLAYMFMHESCLLVRHIYFNTMKLWTSGPNLHFSLVDTIFCSSFCLFCLLSCLLARLYACFLASLLAMSTILICFMPLSYVLCIFSFHCLSASFLSLPFACTHME